MKKGYYSQLNNIIRQKKIEGQYLIDRDKLEHYIDLSDEEREDIEDMCKKAMISVMLYQNNYRSCVRGQGVFIDTDAIRSKSIAKLIEHNSELDVKQKKAALMRLKRIADDLPDDEYSQIGFDEEGILFEEMTKQELIEIIHDLQNQVVNL